MSWFSPSCFKSHPYHLGKPLAGRTSTQEEPHCFPAQSDSIRAICFGLLFCRLMPVALPHQVIPPSETPAFPARGLRLPRHLQPRVSLHCLWDASKFQSQDSLLNTPRSWFLLAASARQSRKELSVKIVAPFAHPVMSQFL